MLYDIEVKPYDFRHPTACAKHGALIRAIDTIAMGYSAGKIDEYTAAVRIVETVQKMFDLVDVEKDFKSRMRKRPRQVYAKKEKKTSLTVTRKSRGRKMLCPICQRMVPRRTIIRHYIQHGCTAYSMFFVRGEPKKKK